MSDRPTREDACAAAGWCWLAAALIVLISARDAFGAQATAASRVQGAVCRVQNRLPGGNNVGSGTLIDKTDDGGEGLVLTCAHLFREGRGAPLVTFGDGSAHHARIVAIDHQADLAALAIANPTGEPVAVASDVNSSTRLSACGFGPRGRYRCAVGPPIGQATDAGQLSLMIAGAVRSGDSGGGVFDEQGNLVAVVWGEASGVTYASYGTPLRSFLRRVLGRRRSTLAACPGGVCPRPGFGSGATRIAPTPARPVDPGRGGQSVVIDPRWQELHQQVQRLEQTKQERGDYVRRSELAGYASSERLAHLEQASSERHASLVERLGELATSSRPGLGRAVGKAAVGVLGISGPVGWAVVAATTLCGWLLGRTIRRNRRGAGGRRRRPFHQ